MTSKSELVDLKRELEFWANNCGGCETCSQVFGTKRQPEFDLQFLHSIVCELLDLKAEKKKAESPSEIQP